MKQAQYYTEHYTKQSTIQNYKLPLSWGWKRSEQKRDLQMSGNLKPDGGRSGDLALNENDLRPIEK